MCRRVRVVDEEDDDDEGDDGEEDQNVGLMHRGLVNDRVKLLESYVAPVGFQVDGAEVRKGTWLLAVRVLADDVGIPWT